MRLKHLGYEPEKMMPGSQLEINANMPKFQVEISISKGGEFFNAGQGFFVAPHLITAQHVIEDAAEIRLKSWRSAIFVPASRFVTLDSDLMHCILDEKERSTLGIATTKLASYGMEIKAGICAKIVAFGTSSIGIVEKIRAVGFVKYLGSTKKGYSGAPYFLGNTVYGMHVGGSTFNIGYEAAYIDMLLRKFSEDTLDYLIQELSGTDEELELTRSPYSPDEYVLRHRSGKYYALDKDDVSKITLARKNRKERGQRYEPESMEEVIQPPPEFSAPLTTENGNIIKPPEEATIPAGMLQYPDSENLIAPPAFAGGAGKRFDLNPVRSQFSSILASTDLESLVKCLPSIVGQRLTPAQQNDLSEGISSILRKREKARLARQRKSNLVSFANAMLATEAGRQIFEKLGTSTDGSTPSTSAQ